MKYRLKYQCLICFQQMHVSRGSDTPEGFARHMRKEHEMTISAYEIMLMERAAENKAAAAKAKQKRR